MNKIKKDDEVIVIAGRSKGKRGKVLRLVKKKEADTDNVRVVVSGVNLIKKHQKADPRNEKPGGIIEREAPIHISNVAIYNPVSKKGDRVGLKILEDGRKVRCYKSNKELIDI